MVANFTGLVQEPTVTVAEEACPLSATNATKARHEKVRLRTDPPRYWTAWLGLLNEMELDLTLTIALRRVFAQPEGVPEDAAGAALMARDFDLRRCPNCSRLGRPRAAVPTQSLGSSLRGEAWRSNRCGPGFCSPPAWA